MKVRIGYVLDCFPSVYQTFVLDEILRLERHGLCIEVFSLTRPPAGQPRHTRLDTLQSKVHYLPTPKGAPWSYLRAAWSLLACHPRRFARAFISAMSHSSRIGLLSFLRGLYLTQVLSTRRIDRLHAHFALGANVVAMVTSRFLDIPFSFTTHASDLFARPVCLCECSRRAQFVVTISSHNRDFITGVCGADVLNKVHVIHAGIDTTSFSTDQTPSRQQDSCILSVGRLVEKKGFHQLVEALAQLAQAGFDFRAIFAGEGPERGALTRLIAQRGLDARVQLVGAVPQDRVRSLYSVSDIFVLACTVGRDGDVDGIPVALMEAMASGLPVVSTRVSGIPELIAHEHEGLLVSEGDLLGLSNAVGRLLSEPATRRRLGQAARQKVLREFDVERSASQLAALFTGEADRMAAR